MGPGAVQVERPFAQSVDPGALAFKHCQNYCYNINTMMNRFRNLHGCFQFVETGFALYVDPGALDFGAPGLKLKHIELLSNVAFQ